MSIADKMQMKDATEAALQPVVKQLYVLKITIDYLDRMLLGDLRLEIIQFHISNMIESFANCKNQKLQITLEKEKRPDGSY